MNVSLTEPLRRFVEERVSSGRYRTASEFVRDCIRSRIVAEREWKARLEAIRRGATPDEAGPCGGRPDASPGAALVTSGTRRPNRSEPGTGDGPDPMDRLLKHRNAIRDIVSRFGGRRVRVFGPIVRGTASGLGDVRLLVELGPDLLGFETTGILWQVRDLTRGHVEVVSEQELDPAALRRIAAEALDL